MSLQSIQMTCAEMLSRLEDIASRCRKMDGSSFNSRIEAAVSSVRTLQDEARLPVRIGLVGAFNAGKTRLLESLLGCAGRLNVIDKPSTGNIVEFELQVGDVTLTQLKYWKIVFMSEVQDAGRILKRLLAEARDLQSRETSRIPDAELDRLLFEAEFEEGSRPQWIKAQEWAGKAHAKARANQFKAVAFEIYRLAYTVGQAGDWLGREFEITEADAISLMSLDYDPESVFSEDLTRWRMQAPALPNGKMITNIGRDQLKSLFPIVRKIVVLAVLPAQVAEPFGGSAGLDMRLVDCPGAGADGSNFRDTVLCAQELQDVDSVFALLNAKNPGENRQFIDELLRIWGAEAKDRILAVVSRFDELPHDKNASSGARDALATASAPITASDVFAAIPTLDTMYKAATHTVMDRDPERICFVSTMAYLTERLDRERGGLRGTPEFYQKELDFPPKNAASGHLDLSWVKEMERWDPVAKKLASDSHQASQSLSELLQDFSNDGGFSRLHRILQRHLSQHGQSNKLARLMPIQSDLLQLVSELEVAVSELKAPVTKSEEKQDSPVAVGEVIHVLFSIYQSFLSQAESDARDFPLIRRAAGSLKVDPTLPPIRRWLISEINRWDEWQLLFSRMNASGVIELVTDRRSKSTGPVELNDELRTPIKSDDFWGPFVKTLLKVQKVLRERCRDAMRYHGELLKRELDGRLGASIGVERLSDAIAAIGLEIDPLQPIHEGIGTAWIDGCIPDFEADPNTTVADYFPLQRGVGKPLYYAWYKPLHDKFGHQFTDRNRHFMYVIRLRQVVIDGALYWLDDIAMSVQQEMRRAILDRLKLIRNTLKVESDKLQKGPGDEITGPAD